MKSAVAPTYRPTFLASWLRFCAITGVSFSYTLTWYVVLTGHWPFEDFMYGKFEYARGWIAIGFFTLHVVAGMIATGAQARRRFEAFRL